MGTDFAIYFRYITGTTTILSAASYIYYKKSTYKLFNDTEQKHNDSSEKWELINKYSEEVLKFWPNIACLSNIFCRSCVCEYMYIYIYI